MVTFGTETYPISSHEIKGIIDGLENLKNIEVRSTTDDLRMAQQFARVLQYLEHCGYEERKYLKKRLKSIGYTGEELKIKPRRKAS